jgi:hypothetical protein
VPQPVHAGHPKKVVPIDRYQPNDRGNTDEYHDRQDEDRGHGEGGAEAARLRDQGQRDDRARGTEKNMLTRLNDSVYESSAWPGGSVLGGKNLQPGAGATRFQLFTTGWLFNRHSNPSWL